MPSLSISPSESRLDNDVVNLHCPLTQRRRKCWEISRIPAKRTAENGDPVKVNVHDFPDPELGKAIPYGVYDLNHNEAGVSVGITHDTAEFAVEAIRRWWYRLGTNRYRNPRRLLITADSGGSNSSRNRLWKTQLQKLADETGMIIEVCHFPPGTSKWNKIEHRVFCHITRNWQGVPLETVEIIVKLIGSTRTETGLGHLNFKSHSAKVKFHAGTFAFSIHREITSSIWSKPRRNSESSRTSMGTICARPGRKTRL